MRNPPPFFVNADDRCWQCALRSALQYFKPEKVWTWDELYELSGKEEGGTWAFKTCAELPSLGYEMHVISDLDPQKFAANPEAYIRNFYKEGAAFQLESTNLPLEGERAAHMAANLKNMTFENRNFVVNDMRHLLAEGYLLITWVNPYKLDRKEGSGGHFILVYDVDGDDVIYHDFRNLKNDEARYPARRETLEHLVFSAKDGDNMEGIYAIRPKQHA